MRQNNFDPVFRGCLYEKRDGTENVTGRFLSFLHEKEPGEAIFGSITLKIWFSKMMLTNVSNVHRNLLIIELDTSILIFFFFAGMTSFLLAVKLLQWNNIILFSLFQEIKHFQWKCRKFKQSSSGRMYLLASFQRWIT